MSNVVIPPEEWKEFLDEFTRRYQGWLVQMEIHDRETEEDVSSQFRPLCGVELDTEDSNNPRINVTFDREHTLIKHVLFRPSRLILCLLENGAEEALHISSLNTSTTLRFRVAVPTDAVDEVA